MRNRLGIFFAGIAWLLSGCEADPPAYGRYLEPSDSLTAFVFLGTECPLSQNYTRTLNGLQAQYRTQGLRVLGVFSVSDDHPGRIDTFSRRYQLRFPVIRDAQQELAGHFSASLTPEVFLTGRQGQLLYAGQIDNWFVDLGKQRSVITRHYLRQAIEAALAGQAVSTNRTEAVGCYIHALPDCQPLPDATGIY